MEVLWNERQHFRTVRENLDNFWGLPVGGRKRRWSHCTVGVIPGQRDGMMATS
jgi:hypothetical protein